MHSCRRPMLWAITTLTVGVSLLIPVSARADTTVVPANASQYNSTPDCPVSAADPVCVWNVPQDAANPFTAGDYGQCPYWAAEKYPALVSDEPASDPLGEDWDGSTWAEHAEAEGLAVSSTPVSGDLAVWQATAGDTPGHVAYVETTDGDGIIVSQMDGDSSAPFPALQGSTEYISAANLAYFQSTYGLEFVQTGDPSTTPLADLEIPAAPSTTATIAVTTPTPSAPATTTPPSTTSTHPTVTNKPRSRPHAHSRADRRARERARMEAIRRAEARGRARSALRSAHTARRRR